MKTGIVADNYKLEKFKVKLDEKGFVYTISSYKNELSLIQVICKEDQVNEIKKICMEVELHFKRSN